MASAPPAPPESIILSGFSGIKNTVSDKRLKQDELVSAVNVDLDDVGMATRRRGRMLIDSTPHHSLKTLGDMTLVVRAGRLCIAHARTPFEDLGFVGDDPLCYVRVGDVIYFASRTSSGKVVGKTIVPWGEQGAGQWISPVLRPTETLGAISGTQLTAPPTATCMEVYNGRIYLGHGRVVWATQVYLYDLVDRTKNFIQTEADVTMIAAVDDGIYVGTTEELLFLEGLMSKGLKQTRVMKAGVIPGSDVVVPYVKAVPQARQGPVPEGYGPMFMTTAGVVVALNGGNVFNLTQDHMIFPGAVSAAALYREDQGANSYVAVTDSAGGPSANARIGDYVDAEVIRASQRG